MNYIEDTEYIDLENDILKMHGRIFVLLNFLDVLTTIFALNLGLIEVNPLMNWLFEKNIFIAIVFKISIVFLINFIAQKTKLKIFFNIVNLMMTIVVISNLYNILRIFI